MRPLLAMIGVASALAMLASCSAGDATTRASCVARFVSEQPGLSHGIGVFDGADGKLAEASGDWVAHYRLLTGRQLQAASLSKPIVANDIRKLVEAGTLTLDGSAIDALPHDFARPPDAAHAAMRIRHLLQHTAGFDREHSGDPLWTDDFPNPPVPSCAQAANRALSQPLDFPPGQRVAYSNAGYCLLGEILLAHGGMLSAADRNFLRSPLGAAGGWTSVPAGLHARLKQTLPLAHLEPTVALPDQSHYDYGWRHWTRADNGPPWTHFGRLPGLLTLAVTDGRTQLLVAYFDGDPPDVDQTALRLAGEAWKCMRQSRLTPPKV